jgi:hypothetical protein
MFNKSIALAGLLAAATIGTAGAADLPVKAPVKVLEAPFFLVNDNSVSYHYEFNATNPGAGNSPKHVSTFTHFDVWAYGTNFFNIDWLKATNGTTTPAAPCGFPNAFTGCVGYTEIYGLYRSTLGWNQIFNTKMFSAGPLTNIEFVWGTDFNTDNTTLESAKRSIQAGLQADFATPYKGFINVGAFAYKEWQNDGIAKTLGTNPTGKVEFDTTWAIEALYVQPLGFLPASIPLTFKSFAVIHGPKGAGETGAAKRTTEYLTQQTLSLDVGQMVMGKPGKVAIWAAYRWWKNKFGIDPVASGLGYTLESTWLTGATWTF